MGRLSFIGVGLYTFGVVAVPSQLFSDWSCAVRAGSCGSRFSAVAPKFRKGWIGAACVWAIANGLSSARARLRVYGPATASARAVAHGLWTFGAGSRPLWLIATATWSQSNWLESSGIGRLEHRSALVATKHRAIRVQPASGRLCAPWQFATVARCLETGSFLARAGFLSRWISPVASWMFKGRFGAACSRPCAPGLESTFTQLCLRR